MLYSVPYKYIKHKVDVRVTDKTIEIFYKHNRIVAHRRLYGCRGQYGMLQRAIQYGYRAHAGVPPTVSGMER